MPLEASADAYTRKKNNLYLLLSGIVLTNALVAEIIGVKIFSGEATLGFPPAQVPVLGTRLDFNMSAGVVVWPLVFVISDIINEYFGRSGVRRISTVTAIFIAYSFLAIFLVTLLPPAAFWLDINGKGNNGAPFDINYAFSTIFRQGLGIITGSISAFLLGQVLDAQVFHSVRKVTGHRRLWLRATFSTLVSQLVDSFVVLYVAFYVFGNWSLTQVFSVALINYIYKASVAILITPMLYVVHRIVDNYLGKESAARLIEEALSK